MRFFFIHYVAEKAGVANARVVGFALHVNKNTKEVPCHRVIKSDGTLAQGYAFGGKDIQRKLLEQEGITFSTDNHITNLSTSMK